MKDLSEKEMQEIIGGNIWIKADALAIATYDAAADFIEGFGDSWNSTDSAAKSSEGARL